MKYDKDAIEKRNNIKIKLQKVTSKIAFIMLIILIYNIFLVLISSMGRENKNSFLGYSGFVITTTSMRPNINVGDIIIVKETDKDKLNENDIITYKKNREIITHRIVRVVKEENVYITKGDNNNLEDVEKVRYEEIIGKKVIKIPYVGYIILILNNKIFVLISIVIIIVVYLYINNLVNKKRMRREKKKIEDKRFQKKNHIENS